MLVKAHVFGSKKSRFYVDWNIVETVFSRADFLVKFSEKDTVRRNYLRGKTAFGIFKFLKIRNISQMTRPNHKQDNKNCYNGNQKSRPK